MSRLRQLWQPPRRASEDRDGRRVTFLELFYDLVYVVIIAQLSHDLAGHLSGSAIGRFVFLFVIVWWAWINGSSYHDVHGNEDLGTRVFMFLQMFTVVAMAIFAHDALGSNSTGFALSYAAFQLILTFLWWRTGVYDPKHRPLSLPYSAGFLISTLLFVGSVFVPMPTRFYLWGAALLVSLALPAGLLLLGSKDPEAQEEVEILSRLSPALVERFGLFTIIVLGEVIVSVVAGVTEQSSRSWHLGGIALLSTLLAIGAWWLYFDFISEHIPGPGALRVTIWLYAHLPMTIAITGLGVATLNIVEHVGEALTALTQGLLVASLAILLVSIVGLLQTLPPNPKHHQRRRVGRVTLLFSAAVTILLGSTNLPSLPLLALMVLLLFVPALAGTLAFEGGAD